MIPQGAGRLRPTLGQNDDRALIWVTHRIGTGLPDLGRIAGFPFTYGPKCRMIHPATLLYRPLSFALMAKLVLSILHGLRRTAAWCGQCV